MEYGEARSQRGRRGPRYEGEDLSPTTAQELKGFYAYGVAAEVFAVCGVGKLFEFSFGRPASKISCRILPSGDIGAARSRTRGLVVG